MRFRVRFYHYCIVSTIACAALFTHALLQYDGFFDTLMYLSTAKICLAVVNNFFFMLFIGFGRVFLRIFVGQLRDLELEELQDTGRGFLMDTVLFLVLSSPTIDGEEVGTLGLLKYILFVVTLKIFHLISQTRVAHLFEVGLPRRDILLRLLGLMNLLLLLDILAVRHFFLAASKDSTFYFWVLFECLGMLATGVSNLLKFTVHWIDLRMDSGWPSKNAYVFYLDLTHDVISLSIFLMFMVVFFINNPNRLPLYMTADILQVLRTLVQRIRSFQRYRQLTSNMDARFPNATEEEIKQAERCIICRDLLSTGAKKLPCGHIFHTDCVKSWFVQQQSCPMCRADIPVDVEISPPQYEEEEGRAEEGRRTASQEAEQRSRTYYDDTSEHDRRKRTKATETEGEDVSVTARFTTMATETERPTRRRRLDGYPIRNDGQTATSEFSWLLKKEPLPSGATPIVDDSRSNREERRDRKRKLREEKKERLQRMEQERCQRLEEMSAAVEHAYSMAEFFRLQSLLWVQYLKKENAEAASPSKSSNAEEVHQWMTPQRVQTEEPSSSSSYVPPLLPPPPPSSTAFPVPSLQSLDDLERFLKQPVPRSEPQDSSLVTLSLEGGVSPAESTPLNVSSSLLPSSSTSSDAQLRNWRKEQQERWRRRKKE